MTDAAPDYLEFILRQCATATPHPWFPSDYARDVGVARDQLDEPLARLRTGCLIQIVDWVKGKGQGYAVTPEGLQVLENPRDLERLRAGTLHLEPELSPELPMPLPL